MKSHDYYCVSLPTCTRIIYYAMHLKLVFVGQAKKVTRVRNDLFSRDSRAAVHPLKWLLNWWLPTCNINLNISCIRFSSGQKNKMSNQITRILDEIIYNIRTWHERDGFFPFQNVFTFFMSICLPFNFDKMKVVYIVVVW